MRINLDNLDNRPVKIFDVVTGEELTRTHWIERADDIEGWFTYHLKNRITGHIEHTVKQCRDIRIVLVD